MPKENGHKQQWKLQREKILFFSGLGLIAFQSVAVTVFDAEFHFEFLLSGLALCGVGIAQWGDRKDL